MRKTRNVLVIGSAGYLGRVVTDQLQEQAHVLATHRSKPFFPDSKPFIFERDDVGTIVRQYDIDTIVIAANMALEAKSEEAIHAFQQAARRFIQACKHYRVVFISSDGLFDGRKGLYKETDRPQPQTTYGRNLFFFEELVREQCANYCIVRPSYLYGYALGELDGRLQDVRERLLTGETVESFSDMFKSPMAVQQVAQGICRLTVSGFQGIIHIAGERMSIYDFYRKAMEALGVSCERLVTKQIPDGKSDLLRDTSLDITAMKAFLGIEPLGIGEVMSKGE